LFLAPRFHATVQVIVPAQPAAFPLAQFAPFMPCRTGVKKHKNKVPRDLPDEKIYHYIDIFPGRHLSDTCLPYSLTREYHP